MGVGVAAGAVVLPAALAGAMACQAQRVARERDRTRIERDRADRVSGFLVSLFEASDPDRSKGDKLTARELLDKGIERLGAEVQNEPETRASLLHSVRKVYVRLDSQDAAERTHKQALPFHRGLLSHARLDFTDTLNELGKVHSRTGDYDRAEAADREALEFRRRYGASRRFQGAPESLQPRSEARNGPKNWR